MRLAIVATHPIQYYSPWFLYLSRKTGIELKVFYLWDFGVRVQVDPGFGSEFEWDIDLLSGYIHEFVANTAARPGTARFFGFRNPELQRRLDRFQPDAILLMAYRYWEYIKLIRYARRRKLPLLFRGDSHRMVNATSVKSRLARPLIRLLFSRFSACLYVGKANREYFRYHGVPDPRLFQCPHAVDNERFFAATEAAASKARGMRQELDIPAAAPVILFAGKFEAKKRPQDLVAAFARLGTQDAYLVLAGDGPLRGALEQATRAMKNLRLLPFQNQTRMPALYALADLVALPSFGSSETWGLCINEAMCMSRAVLVSDHVGCGPDLVADRRTGWIFEAGNVDALARALKQALADPGELKRRGARARSLIRDYDYAAATSGLERALAAVLR